MSAYEQIAELAEAALPLAEEGKLEEVAAALDRCEELAAALPERPPSSALPALERALAAQEGLRAALGGSLAAVRTDLDRVELGRRVARGYGEAGAALLDRHA